MGNQYTSENDQVHGVAEPSAVYGAATLNKLWEYIRVLPLSNDDKDWLAGKIIGSKQIVAAMPCTFTDEEWLEEIQQSLAEGDATEEETKSFYEKWGIAL